MHGNSFRVKVFLCVIQMHNFKWRLESTCILAEKRNGSINSGVVFLKKIVDFI